MNAKSYYEVPEDAVRRITRRQFLRLKPGDKVLFGRADRFTEVTFTGHSEKHPRSWFKYEETFPGNELPGGDLYVWTNPKRNEIYESIGYGAYKRREM